MARLRTCPKCQLCKWDQPKEVDMTDWQITYMAHGAHIHVSAYDPETRIKGEAWLFNGALPIRSRSVEGDGAYGDGNIVAVNSSYVPASEVVDRFTVGCEAAGWEDALNGAVQRAKQDAVANFAQEKEKEG